ncbi:hypothetical protein RO3G_08932 [Rhizopus delemar RA 99-880]|uniref:Uncharacterized protein n=3 Tax=Rhizopus TaxID=4842 RepID=I1C6Z2_RHIO9|nr:hypothetical protein RO3G_08932 [Rhizopus delemar RA 99-880]|eukprot:EIE84222.1 hypothetical protein RO3G_08932 [Rhizopus delemar RA 99-880]
MSLKRLQYLLSGDFRLLDVLGLEISQDVNNDNVRRYLHMLKDCQTLFLNALAQTNDMRNNVAFQTINPSFSFNASANNHNFIMSPAKFQAALVQQTDTSQAIKNASSFHHSFNRRLAAKNDLLRVQNHVRFPSSTSLTTSTYNSVQQQNQLLDHEVSLLLKKGAMEEVPPTTPGFYSSMFVIPKKNGGSRPVFNLKKLNNYIQAPHFKMETLQEVTKQIKHSNDLTSTYLSDDFLHIPVHPKTR